MKPKYKTLSFKNFFVDKILKGEKTQTIRLAKCYNKNCVECRKLEPHCYKFCRDFQAKYKVTEVVKLIDEEKKEFGKAVITSVSMIDYSDLKSDSYLRLILPHEGFDKGKQEYCREYCRDWNLNKDLKDKGFSEEEICEFTGCNVCPTSFKLFKFLEYIYGEEKLLENPLLIIRFGLIRGKQA